MKKLLTVLVLIFFSLIIFSQEPNVSEENSKEAIKARMKSRYSAMKKLKVTGIIGENQSGFVEIVDQKKTVEEDVIAIVKAENNDRNQLYSLIAANTEASAEEVAANNAVRIFKKAGDNEYFEDKKGTWSKKKNLVKKE